MGVTIARTRFAIQTGTGNFTQDVTTTDLGGLTPKAAIFFTSNATADGTVTDGLFRGVGVCDGSGGDGTAQAWVLFSSRHGTSSSSTGVRQQTSRVLENYNIDTSTVYAMISWNSWIENGIRLSITQVGTMTPQLVEAIFFAGDNLSVDVTATTLTNAVDTAHDITGPGFEPDDVICFTAAGNGAGMGFVHNDRAGTITQRSMYHRSRSGRPTMEIYSYLSESCGGMVPVGAFDSDYSCKLEFSDFDSSGFTVTTRNAAPGSSVIMVCLALRYGTTPVVASKNYTFSTPTATGSNTDTGPGFPPQFVMYGANLMEAASTFYTDSLAGSSGVSTITDTSQHFVAWSDEDTAADANTQSLMDDVAVNLPLHDGSAGMSATFTEFASNGVTLSWSDVESNPKKWIAFAIEGESSGASLIVADASHAHDTGENLALAQHNEVAPADANHAHDAEENFGLTQHHILVVDDANHAHDPEEPVLTAHGPSVQLVTADASHAHAVESPNLTQHHQLSPNDAAHEHSASSVVVEVSLFPQGALHAHTSDEPVLSAHVPTFELEAQEAAHAHAVESADLVQHSLLDAEDASHAHAAESVALAQHHLLTPEDSLHGHTADNLIIAAFEAGVLGVQEARHTHAVESPALVQHSVITVAGAAHAHSAENVTLSITLIVHGATHSQAAESPELTQHSTVTVADAVHAQVADNIDLITEGILAVQDAAHGHSAESPELVQHQVLIVDDSLHGLFGDAVVILVHDPVFEVYDANHSHLADNLTLTPHYDVTIPIIMAHRVTQEMS